MAIGNASAGFRTHVRECAVAIVAQQNAGIGGFVRVEVFLDFRIDVAVAARAAVQLLLVVALFAVGRGIGGILGAMTGFPTLLPVAISFLSIPLARMIWDPWAQPPVPNAAVPNPSLSSSDAALPLDADAAPTAIPPDSKAP